MNFFAGKVSLLRFLLQKGFTFDNACVFNECMKKGPYWDKILFKFDDSKSEDVKLKVKVRKKAAAAFYN